METRTGNTSAQWRHALYTWRAPAPSFPVPFSVSRVFVPRNTTRRRIHGEKWSLDQLPATPNVDELHCLGGTSLMTLIDSSPGRPFVPEMQMFYIKNLFKSSHDDKIYNIRLLDNLIFNERRYISARKMSRLRKRMKEPGLEKNRQASEDLSARGVKMRCLDRREHLAACRTTLARWSPRLVTSCY